MPDDGNAQPGLCQGDTERARIVTDYIAGMTDRFALQEHRRLTDPMVKGDGS
jgi:dGTPase